MKTVKEHFNEVQDSGLKEKLFKNTQKEALQWTARDLEQSVKGAFLWEDTDEGYKYWNQITKNLS
tara:strand:- start:315 stop:509 length:195 start_codon:yes stop_codon:yes gene_type:complete